MTTAFKEKKLKPCKKCKSTDYVWLYLQNYNPYWLVGCKKCGNKAFWEHRITSGLNWTENLKNAAKESVIDDWNNQNT